MAKKATQTATVSKRYKKKVTRPGVHAKTKTSVSKRSKFYKKKNVGQGR